MAYKKRTSRVSEENTEGLRKITVKSMKKVMTALAKMVAVFGIMAVSSLALYMEYVRKHD